MLGNVLTGGKKKGELTFGLLQLVWQKILTQVEAIGLFP